MMDPLAVHDAVEDAHRSSWTTVLTETVRVTKDLGLAEECVQTSYEKALSEWCKSGIPRSPVAWLIRTARNRALDLIRRKATAERALPLLVIQNEQELWHLPYADDSLRLIFMCCHPALSADDRIALTLRFVCGVPTNRVARCFLVSPEAMAARLTRAKKKIAVARIPYRIPEIDEFPSRLDTVLDVVHLILTLGYNGEEPLAQTVAPSLTGYALDLARTLHRLFPQKTEVLAVLALVLFTKSREPERLDSEGRLKTLSVQNRARWDRAAISEGLDLVPRALRGRPTGKYALLSAIQALHCEADDWETTDWPQILGLYDQLLLVWRTPVVALNRSVAVRYVHGVEAALSELERIEDSKHLARYSYFSVTRASLLKELGRLEEAQNVVMKALHLVESATEREFLLDHFKTV